MEATVTPKQVSTTIEILQSDAAGETLEQAKREFKRLYPDRGEPTDAQFSYAYPAETRGGPRWVGIVIAH